MKQANAQMQTDEQLMKQVCKGNKQAFEQLYERYFDKLVWFSMQFLSSKQVAEDVVQEVFIKVMEQPESFDSGRTFSTWVYTITANLSKNILRNEGNRNRLLNEQPFTEETRMQQTFDYQKLKQTLSRVVGEMSEKERTLFVLRFEHDLPLKNIAEITGLPEGSVKSGIYYLLKKISKHINPFRHGN